MTRPRRGGSSRFSKVFAFAVALAALGWGAAAQAQLAVNAPLTGEIEMIMINNINDHWSGGTLVVGGQVVTVPRNLLIDLPANRVTLKQLYDEAPAACVAAGETGLAKADICNATGAGGFATVTANRTSAGNVIAGDLFIAKGLETITGIVTYIDFTDGYFRLNGAPNDPTTGVMVRLNDPDARHTIQQGLGCVGGSPNCSPDPRFTLDPDNYTNHFSTGYPLCIPSTVARTFDDVLGLGTTTAQSGPNGVGDVLCPAGNRSVLPVPDSRRFAPILLGDQITVEGNFETIDGVRFLSAHTSNVGVGLTTRPAPDQPDYLVLEEFEVDAPGFQNERLRTLMIGFATLAPVDVLIWSLHYDPLTNGRHEFPMASVRGCDIAGGPQTCSIQGLAGQGNLIWKIRHDVDFLIGAKPRVNPCAHLMADVRFGSGLCSSAAELNITDQFAIMSPIPHEVQARTGHSLLPEGSAQRITLDVSGVRATNGQYLFPFGVGLGGIAFPEMVEIDLNALATPFSFTGLPWTLDRRLSPAGCIDTTGDGNVDCEATPQPLDPYPYEGLDPRFLASLPANPYNASAFTASPLSDVRNRILSFVDGNLGKFDGDNTILALPTTGPALIPIPITPMALPACGIGGVNQPVVTVADAVFTSMNVATTIDVLANDTGTPDPTTLGIVGQPLNGTAVVNAVGAVTFTPTQDFVGVTTFDYVVNDRLGAPALPATVTVTVNGTPPPGSTPVAAGDSASTLDTTPVSIAVLANDSDNGFPALPADPLNPLTVTVLTQPASGTATRNADNTVTYTPVVGFEGQVSFTYQVSDTQPTTSNVATVAVTVTRVNVAPTLLAIGGQTAAGQLIRAAGVAADIGVPTTVHVNAMDSPGDTLVFSLPTAPSGMSIGASSGLIAWTPDVTQVGAFPVTVRVTDQGGLFAEAGFTVTVAPDTVSVLLAQFRTRLRRWKVEGVSSAPGATITIFNTATLKGAPLGTATADAFGVWRLRINNARRLPSTTRRISVSSDAGGSVLNVPVSVIQ